MNKDLTLREPLQGPRPRRASPAQLVLLDLVVVIVIALIGQYLPPVQIIKYDAAPIHTLVYCLWLAVSVVFLFRRRYPRVVLAVLLVLLFIGLCLRFPAPAANYLAFALYSVVVTSRRPVIVVASVGSFVVAVAGMVIGGGPQEVGAIAGLVVNLFLGWIAGAYVQTARSYSALRAEFVTNKAAAAEAARAERVRGAVAEERAKLARELHDVVAHGMSVVAVRAGVARMVIETQPDQAREALAIIETTSRRTLQEMRLLVGVLRGDRDQEADREPAPGLENLPGLIAQSRLAGLDIDLSIEGGARSLAPALDLSAYRIVQEALTNAARHAGPTVAHIAIDYHADHVDIHIRDEGPRPGFVPDPDLDGLSAGHGLIGIGERAALFGGTCITGPLGTGFHVRVTLRTTDLQSHAYADSSRRTPARADVGSSPVTQQSVRP